MNKVLVIDDDALYLDVVKSLLKEAGYEVETCQNPHEGLRLLKENPPQCVLLDFSMPGLDGEDVLDLIHSKHPEIPVIVCSGYLDAEDPHFLREGAYAILRKPYEHGVLLDTVGRAVASEQNLMTIMIESYNLKKAKETLIRKLIIKALGKMNFNVALAANLLGVSRQCLFAYIKRLKISY